MIFLAVGIIGIIAIIISMILCMFLFGVIYGGMAKTADKIHETRTKRQFIKQLDKKLEELENEPKKEYWIRFNRGNPSKEQAQEEEE